MNAIQKKWFIILQGLFFSLAGVSLLTQGFDKVNIALLMSGSALAGLYFLVTNKNTSSLGIYKSMLTIEVVVTIIAALAFYLLGDTLSNFALVFGVFSIFFGIIPFLFLFGILTSDKPLKFEMAKFRLIGGVLALIFGFYLLVSGNFNAEEAMKYIGITMIIIGIAMMFGFRIVEKLFKEDKSI